MQEFPAILPFLFGHTLFQIIINGVLFGLSITLILHFMKKSKSAPSREFVCYEVVPSINGSASQAQAIQFFSTLCESLRIRNSDSTMFEIDASYGYGIRYLFTTVRPQASILEQKLHGYLPKAKITPIARKHREGTTIVPLRLHGSDPNAGYLEQLHAILAGVQKQEHVTLQVQFRGALHKKMRTTMRLEISAPQKERQQTLLAGALSALAPASIRVPLFAWPNVISPVRAATLFHIFEPSLLHQKNVAHTASDMLPALPEQKRNHRLDLVLGRNEHYGESSFVGLTTQDRKRHMFVLGGTGNGKSTLLLSSILQDIQHGKGVALIDPHGDLALDVLSRIPKERIEDVIYFNPRDLEYPLGLNLLELPKHLEGSNLEHQQDIITEATISVLRKLFSEAGTGGHRIEYILRSAIHTAFHVEDATIFTILKLLTNSSFRWKIVKKIDDQYLKDFWHEEIAKAGSMQQVKMTSGVTAKIGRFYHSAAARKVLEQPVSTIDFVDLMNSGKILICNFSKGALGEDTADLFGTTVLAKMYLASLQREDIPLKKRRPFYIYIDEFQNFASPLFNDLLTQARKYQIFLTIAEQTTAQQKDRFATETLLGNVGVLVSFRTGSLLDEQLILPRLEPFVAKGSLSRLPAYHFYTVVSGKEVRETAGITIPPKARPSKHTVDRIITLTRERVAKGHEPTSTNPADAPEDQTADWTPVPTLE